MRVHKQAPVFNDFAEAVIIEREAIGVSGMKSERSRLRTHISTAPWADFPMSEIETVDLAEWRRELVLNGQICTSTISKCQSLVSCIFDAALEQGYVSTNPTKSLPKYKRRKEGVDPEKDHINKWDFLKPKEQQALINCEAIPEPDRLLMAFAIGTGLRQGEQWSLRLKDIHLSGERPYIVVKYGSADRAPKSGKSRKVPLFGIGLDATKRWLDIIHSVVGDNPRSLAFPTIKGGFRPPMAPLAFKTWLMTAKIKRNIRWHDLRHTFGSSLVAGWWGRKWSLLEVRDIMGHSAITMTEKYAHLAQDAIFDAAEETQGGWMKSVAPSNPPR